MPIIFSATAVPELMLQCELLLVIKVYKFCEFLWPFTGALFPSAARFKVFFFCDG